jgi:hypothetical protein
MFTLTGSSGRVAAAVSLLAVGFVAASDEQSDAELHFARGQEIVARNVGDSPFRGSAVLLSGIEELRLSIRLGYHDPIVVYRLVADAFATLCANSPAGSAEAKRYGEEERNALRHVADLDPTDTESRLRYAESSLVVSEKLAAYGEVLKIEPDNTTALYDSGRILLRKGRTGEGLDRLERAAEAFRPDDAKKYGADVVRLLKEHGRKKRAAVLEKQMAERVKRAKPPEQ